MQSEDKPDGNLFAALNKAQLEMEGAKKDRSNPHFRRHYETYHATVEAFQKWFAPHGLAFCQPLRKIDGERVVVTQIHLGEAFISDDGVPLLLDKQNMQGLKSATTYARRIGLQMLTGIAPSDDDGNDAVKTPGENREPLKAKVEQKDKPAFWRDERQAGSDATSGNGVSKFEGQYQVMSAQDGSQQGYPRTPDGARQAVAMIERLAEDDQDNWQCNRELARQIAKDFGKLKDEAFDAGDVRYDLTITERLKFLAETAEGQANPLNAG